MVTAYGWCTAWRARNEASIRARSFGPSAEACLERALRTFSVLSARHVILPLPTSQDYNLATQIGRAPIYVLCHPADPQAMPCCLHSFPGVLNPRVPACCGSMGIFHEKKWIWI